MQGLLSLPADETYALRGHNARHPFPALSLLTKEGTGCLGWPKGRLASRMRRVRKGRAARRDIPELWSDRRVTAANSCDNRLLRSYLVQTRQLPQAPEAGSVRQPVIDVRVPNPNGDDADTARQ